MSGHVFTQKSKTHQSFAAGVNIRNIAGRVFQGQPIPLRDGIAMYGDFTGTGDLQEAMQKVDAARAFFGQLPARVRAEFRNDPLKYCDLVEQILAGDVPARARGIGLGIVEPTEKEVKYIRALDVAAAKQRLLSLDPTALDSDSDSGVSG